MARSAQDRCVEDVERLCAAGQLDGLELLRRATERLRRVVPFDFYCANVADPMSGVTARARLEPVVSRLASRLFFDRYYFEDYVPAFHRMAQERRAAVSLSEETSGRPELASRYREWMLPGGFAHELRMVCVAGGAIWGSLDLMRVPARPDFSAGEIRLAQRLAATLGEGLRAATIRAEDRGEEGGGVATAIPPLPGVVVLDAQETVLRYTRAAERLLSEIEPLRPEWAEAADLPIVVRVLAGAVKQAPNEERVGQTDSLRSVRVRAPSGRWLTLEADVTEPRGHGPVETTIVIRPTPPQDMARVKAAAYGLSAREKEVVDHVLLGASTTEIARTLYLSEYTIQEHLQNAFEKVGVRGRRALLRRLFFDDLHAALTGPPEAAGDPRADWGGSGSLGRWRFPAGLGEKRRPRYS